METIQIREQVRLTLRRCFQLCLRGIGYRLFRSAITVVIVSLAVAFLMMMLSGSYIDREVAADVRARTAGRRLLEEWVDKLTVPMTGAVLAGKLAAVAEGSPAWRELANWGGLQDEQLRRLKSVALRQRVYQRYLGQLKPGERSSLVGTRQEEAVFAYLAEPGQADEFFDKARKFSTPLPADREALRQFVEEYAGTADLRRGILSAQAAAVEAVGRELGQRSALEALTAVDEKTPDLFRRHGYLPDSVDFAALAGEAALARDAQILAALLREERMRGVIANRVGESVSTVNEVHVYQVGSRSDGAAWLREEVQRTRQKTLEKAAGKPVRVPEPLDLPVPRIVQVCRGQLEQIRLAAVEGRLSSDSEDVWLGFSRRTGWLIIISFVVCVVGVTNAMLMSVTERFREIATMKCLGALDSFIMVVFVMESALLGVAGGGIGIVIGLVLGLVRSWWGLGALALVNLPGWLLLASAGVCLVCGTVLAALAAMYPAWVAARLAPMEAMRIE